MNKLIERIVSDAKICSGKPCIKGTRIPVHIVLDLLAAGESFEGIKSLSELRCNREMNSVTLLCLLANYS